MGRGHEETGIFKVLKEKEKNSLRLENKRGFNNVGIEPKTATLPLGIKTLSCVPGRITKQSDFPFSYLPAINRQRCFV